MNRRLFRREVSQSARKISVPYVDKVGDEPAYTLSNILQSAQLNRPLPPMRSYNFSSPQDVKVMDVPVTVDDICFAGNLQAQLDVAVTNAKVRKQQEIQNALNNVPQSDTNTEHPQVEKA